MSLRIRLTLWVAVLALLVEGVLAVVTWQETRGTAVQAVQAEMLRMARMSPGASPEVVASPLPGTGPSTFALSSEGRLVRPPEPRARAWVEEALAAGVLEVAEAGVVEFRASDGEEVWFALQPTEPGGLTFGIVDTRRQALAGLDLLHEDVLLVHMAGSIVLILLVWLAAGAITRQLVALEEVVRRLSAGELDVPVPVPTVREGGEVAALARSFAQMQKDLKSHIEELRTTTAERERLASELDIGFQIQRSFLPGGGDGREVDLLDGRARVAACLRPAREMAGDLYDFFPLGPHRLGLCIGDVSGKGLPAALFMAVTHTLVRSAALRAAGPADCLARVNRVLCQENRSQLFVTLLYAVLDLEVGRLTWASGGHLPPVRVSAGGETQLLPEADGMVLGVLGDLEFGEQSIAVAAGDQLLLYTDGLTESSDASGELFGDARLLEAAEIASGASPLKVLEHLQERRAEFTDDRRPSDDLTLLAVRIVS